jgi:CelD/BcsL family acetyltransferase involved in cellulose biosynthesis
MESLTQSLRFSLSEPSVAGWARSSAQAGERQAQIDLALVRDLDAFLALETDWDALFETAGRPQQVFQTFQWLALWAAHFSDVGTRLAIVTGRIDGRLVLAWPLVVQTTFGLRILGGMGEPVSQYCDALLTDDISEAAQDEAFDYVMALPCDLVSFHRVRDDAALAPLLSRRLGAGFNRQASPVVDLAGAPTIEAFEARFSGKARSDRRRRRRRLEERGPVHFAHHRPSLDAAALVALGLGFKRDWAREHGVLAPALRDPRFEQFFVAAALAGRAAPALRVSALHCGDAILGVEISILCKGHLFGHVLAPCPGLGTLGLGGMLAERTIHNAVEQGYASVDLLAPADSYKLEWTTTSLGVGDYLVPVSVVGRLYSRLWLRSGRDAVKTLARRLRPGLAILSRRKGRR